MSPLPSHLRSPLALPAAALVVVERVARAGRRLPRSQARLLAGSVVVVLTAGMLAVPAMGQLGDAGRRLGVVVPHVQAPVASRAGAVRAAPAPPDSTAPPA